MWHVWVKREIHIKFWWGNVKAGGHSKDLGIDRMITLEQILKKCDGVMVVIDVIQDRYKWRTITAVNIQIP
jgi:hypothetical protein